MQNMRKEKKVRLRAPVAFRYHKQGAGHRRVKRDNFCKMSIIADGRLTRCRLGDFLKQDIANPVVFTMYPSSALNTNYPLKNLKKYQTMEFPFYSFDSAAVWAMVTIATIGSEVPVMVLEIPRNLDSLKAHWSRWMPYYEECTDIRVLNDDNLAKVDDGSLFTQMPCEQISDQKYTINPDTFYEIYSKAFIPKIKIKQPRDMVRKEAKAPCVIKVPVAAGSDGVKIATTDREILEYEERVMKMGWKGELVFQERLTDVIGDRGVQLYIHKDGSVNLGGFSNQTFSSSPARNWTGGIFYRTPEEEKINLRMVKFLQPAIKKLHEMGYFGYLCFDVMETRNGELFLTDINPRVSGSNPHVSMIDGMAGKGFPISMFVYAESKDLTISVEQLISRADCLNKGNDDAVIIILAAQATKNGTLKTVISIFATTKCYLLKAKENAFNFSQA
ncbi:unnamed protein product [Owenia fusiformis]|uniref:ATP-grasp domain-containing protein n=1 Tax=Owenia fusiformis TaxID=6347 RepID=A0A8S4PV72_OWEFU|nr:unnamed protein product [Owenia fusiformis]